MHAVEFQNGADGILVFAVSSITLGADKMTATPTLYTTREKATEFIRNDCGVPIGDSRLGDLVNRGGGPRYSIINGRALYTAKDLLAWIGEQASASPREEIKRGHANKKSRTGGKRAARRAGAAA
jgi:hypothetical protein